MAKNKKFTGDAFRLAAVLYADNNYEVKPRTIQRKIVESLFLVNNNNFLTVHEIIDLIQDKYDFIFTEDEISSAINSFRGSHFQIKEQKSEKIICLELDRLELLKSKINHKNIDYFIEEFLKNLVEEIPKEIKGKEVIYRFLYEGLNSNISSFNRLLDEDFDIQTFISNLNHSFNALETRIVNEFLRWDNDDKNKCVFDISSFALEYCLITNKKSDSFFQVNNLKNKNFYIDTNVIIRAIGINGENRKKRTLTFFDKFKEAEEQLILSKYTDEEFKNTVTYYIGEIGKHLSPRINTKVFLEHSTQSDFYDYYFRWKNNRSNDNLELFRASIFSSYDALIRKYKIRQLADVPYNEHDEAYQNRIDELTEQIYDSKRYWARNPDNVSYDSIPYDSKNIYLIEYERKGLSHDIFQTKYFFISTDQLLKKWDLDRKGKTPTVIMPSHWLTILLRYYSRTNDDFKSFVSFLSLSQNGSSISNKNLTTVLNGISEITIDMEEQSQIVKELISQKFKDVISDDFSIEMIEDNAKNFTKSALDKKLENLKTETTVLKGLVGKSEKDIEELKKGITTDKKLKVKYEGLLVDQKISDYRKLGFLYVVLLVISFIFILLIFLFTDKNWNIVQIPFDFANSLPDNSAQRSFAQTLSYAIPIGAVLICVRQINLRFWDKSNLADKRKKFSEELKD